MKISRDSTNRIVYEAERNADVIEFNSGSISVSNGSCVFT